MALTFRQEVISSDTYIERCWQLLEPGQIEIAYSQEESAAFQAWSGEQYQAAKANFVEQRADPERGVLDYIDRRGNVISQTARKGGEDE
jgi:hypothetical protein